MVDPIFRQETEAHRFVAEHGVVHIHDKKTGTVESFPVADQTVGVKPMFDKPRALDMAEFEAMWTQARLAGLLHVQKVIAGGQTGADRGGLDAAIDIGIPHGGYCPKGRKSEDGPIPEKYELEETPSPSYVTRTRKNAQTADATLVFVDGGMSGGSLMTVEYLREIRKPHLVVTLDNWKNDTARVLLAGRVRNWLAAGRFKVLNVAGSRETKSPGIQERVRFFLREVLAR